jgi:hypothetical protein
VVHHVTAWADRSGHGRNAATPGTNMGPLCDANGALSPNDNPALNFPGTTSNQAYGTLNVDLSFMTGSEYTVFVVEQRASNRTRLYLLGGLRPSETTPPNCPANTDQAFHFGYRDSVTFSVDHYCVITDGAIPDYTGSSATEPWEISEATFSTVTGHQLYRNGVAVPSTSADRTNTTPLMANANGGIGRGYSIVQNTRFIGAIAEVVIYDTALGPSDLQAVEAYLRQHWGL